MRYYAPGTLHEALDILRERGADTRVLAGGTDVVVLLKEEKVSQEALLDITHIEGLSFIEREGDAVRIGAMATHGALASSPLIRTHASPLSSACASVGSPQIRNRGTVGGNVSHGSPAGDSIPALMALGARLRLQSSGEERWVPIEEFFLGPGRTVRRSDELLTEIRFPAMRPEDGGFFLKLGQRISLAIAKVSAAGKVSLQDGKITEAAIALGAVAPKVVRARDAEEYLAGMTLDGETAAQAGLLAGKAATPIDDVRSNAGYRKSMVEVLVERGLLGLTR